MPISNSKPDLHNINAHTKFGENPLMFTPVIIREQNTDGHMAGGRVKRHTDVQGKTIVAGYKN